MVDIPRVIAVTDRTLLSAPLADTIAAIAGANSGRLAFQVREKDLTDGDNLALCRDVVAAAHRGHCPVLVNGRIDIAVAAGADGVHLPEAGLAIAEARKLASSLGRGDLLIGKSTHSPAAALAAASAGADLIFLGPIWPTPKKIALGRPLGLAAITEATQAAEAQVYAIGGIDDPARARAARAAGAAGIGVIRAIFAAENPATAARALCAAVSR